MSPALKKALARAKREGWDHWIKTDADRRAVENGCYFDIALAEAARDFFPANLKLSQDRFAGKPFVLEDWQYQNVVGPLFGWRNADGGRRFEKGYLSTAKKNGKTTLYAGLLIYFLLTNGPGTEIYSAGADKQQAGIIYREAKAMIQANPALGRRLRCIDSTKRIVGRGRDFYAALSADAWTKEGINASIVLADELHAWPDRSLYDALNYASSAKTNPLFLIITTAGDDLNTICGEEYLKAKNWLAGTYPEDTYFAYICEADPGDDWTLEETWKKANPSFGVCVPAKKIKTDLAEAIESPALENAFRRYHLNQWVSIAKTWIQSGLWKAIPHNVDPEALAGRECTAGLDLSAIDDLTALMLEFDDGEFIDLVPFFWLPADNIAKLEKKHKVSYRAWAKAGHMELTEGNVVDYRQILKRIIDLGTKYKITKIVIDRKFQGQQLETDIMEAGFDVEPAGQGWISQDVPAKAFEKGVNAKTFRDNGNPILAWNVSNAVVDVDKAGNYSLNKKKSRSKIDGVAALLMGLTPKLRSQTPAKSNYYDENDLIVL